MEAGVCWHAGERAMSARFPAGFCFGCNASGGVSGNASGGIFATVLSAHLSAFLVALVC